MYGAVSDGSGNNNVEDVNQAPAARKKRPLTLGNSTQKKRNYIQQSNC